MDRRKVTIVGSELLGRPGTGGAGTADSLLAVALGRRGHQVELLIASGREIGSLSPEWTGIYDAAGVRIRVLEATAEIAPRYLAPSLEVLDALREEPRDVVIANDWRGLAYLPLRARQTGLALRDTAFVIHCHGPGRVLTAFAGKVPNTLERFGEDVMERACVGLADAVVSPSRWLLDWMGDHAWPVAESARVIQYLRESAALETQSDRASNHAPIRRLAFFGQLREGKGIRIYLDALQAISTDLPDGAELLFLGGDSARWSADRVLSEVPATLRDSTRIETELTREAALRELREPGTLAVMPSLLDNSPNTVAECIEQGIPFVATETGGIGELVAEPDRERVLCPPTADALAHALAAALTSRPGFIPAQPARQPREAVEAWLEVVADVTPAQRQTRRRADAVAVITTSDRSERRAVGLAEHTNTVTVDVVRAESRSAGLFRTSAAWIVFLDDEDEPDDGMLDALVDAQAASGADAVTCAVRRDGGRHVFLGDPGALGLVENQYGVVGLVRASLLVSEDLSEGVSDPDWPLFARIALEGAKLVSLPEPLAAHAGKPGRVDDVPGDAVAVLEVFERGERQLDDLPQLAATVAAAYVRTAQRPAPTDDASGLPRRVARRLKKAVR
jgi:glycosyltransferase involved in cell wall biosynthesis